MIERTNFLNPFWVLMVALIVGLTLFGGFIAWKLLHSATPQIERAQMDPEQLLEQTIAASPDSQAGQTSGDLITQQQGTSTYTQTGTDYTYWDDETEDVPVTSNTKTGSKQASSQNTSTKQTQSSTSSRQDTSSVNEEDFSYRLEDLPAPKPTVAKQPAKPVSATPAKKINLYTNYKEGLLNCQKGRFPCTWQDRSNKEVLKQYWLRQSAGPVQRLVYGKNGNLISQTDVALDGKVTHYKGAFAEFYFEKGLLTKIRTFPYENPNLRDWFLIGNDGKFSACLCGVPTQNCCARSLLYREGGPRRYCQLFPLDKDFCK